MHVTRLGRQQLPKNMVRRFLDFQQELDAQNFTDETEIVTAVCSSVDHAKIVATSKNIAHCFSFFFSSTCRKPNFVKN